jgi:hypothetical protein
MKAWDVSQLKSIGKKAAVRLAELKWWEGKTPREICNVQLFVTELCCPFEVIHKATEEALGRPVYSHEFGLNYEGLVAEFLGVKPPPTLQEIVEMIPEEKRIVFSVR